MHSTRIPYFHLQLPAMGRIARSGWLRSFGLLAVGALVLLAWGARALGQQAATGAPATKLSIQAEQTSRARLPSAEEMQQQLAAAEQASLSLASGRSRTQIPDRETGPAEPGQTGPEASAAHRGDVTVHGHWVIEVKRKDGTLADRREFENSYAGTYIMGLILSGDVAAIDPAILVSSKTNGPGSWCNGGYQNDCTIFNNSTIGHGGVDSVPANGICIVECYTGLTSTLMPDGAGGYNAYVLNVNITAVGSGTFDTVETSVGECYNNYPTVVPVNLSSANCYANAVSYYSSSETINNYDNNIITGTTFGSPMTVTAGQTVTFTVTISFS